MQKYLPPGVDRFKALVDEEKRSAFRDKQAGNVRGYAFLRQTRGALLRLGHLSFWFADSTKPYY
jgi:hypothetical protein